MSRAFKNLTIDIVDEDFCWIEFSPYLKRIRSENKGEIGRVVNDAHRIGIEFLAVFWGSFPSDSFFVSHFGDEKNLPWVKKISADSFQIIESIAQSQLADGSREKGWFDQIYDGAQDPRSVAQQLAVAGLAELDRFLGKILSGNLWAALDRLNSVYWWMAVTHGFIRGRILPSHAEIAAKGANALHDAPGGSRSKQDKIREIWSLGNFSSRDACTEQECAALGMSISAARKALRNTRDPNPWPAMKTKASASASKG